MRSTRISVERAVDENAPLSGKHHHRQRNVPGARRAYRRHAESPLSHGKTDSTRNDGIGKDISCCRDF